MMNPFTLRTRRAALLLACTLSISSAALHAQQTPAQDQAGSAATTDPHAGGHAQHERMIERMTKELNLTPDQVTQIKAIQTDGAHQMRAIHDDASLAAPDKHAKMKELHEAQQSKITALLNDQQKTQFDAMLEKRHEHHHMHPESAPATPATPPAAQ